MEKHPEQRFQSARDLAFAIGSLNTFPGTSGSRLGTPGVLPGKLPDAGVSQRWKWAACALGVVALVANGWLAFRPRPSSLDSPASWVEIGPPGRAEVYIQSFPELGGTVRISSDGGYRPEWRKDGKELYYVTPDGKLMAAAVNGIGSVFQSSPPQPILSSVWIQGSDRQQYHSADGTRFMVNTAVENANPRALTVVLNWKAPGKK